MAMCSCNHGDSVLWLLSVLELKDFSWNTLLRELKKKAPTLLQLLTAASSRRACFNPGIVGMAASLDDQVAFYVYQSYRKLLLSQTYTKHGPQHVQMYFEEHRLD